MKRLKLFPAAVILLFLPVATVGCIDVSKEAQKISPRVPISASISNKAGTSGNPAASSSPGSSGTAMLTLDEIRGGYTDSKILNTQYIGQEYVLVESQRDTFANRFDLYNLKTGNIDTLPTMPQFVTLEKAENENYFEFLASGRNSESPFKRFPHTIKCFRIRSDPGNGDNFLAVTERRYFKLDEPVQAGGKEGSVLSGINITFSGLELLYKPAKGKESGFYADAADIPPTGISYDENTRRIILEIGTSQLGGNLKGAGRVFVKENQYISSYDITLKDDKIYLAVSLKDAAGMYLPEIRSLPNGNMPDLPYFTVEFKGKG